MMMPPEKSVHPWLAHLQGLTTILKAHHRRTGRCFPGSEFFTALESSLGESAWAVNHNVPIDEWFLDYPDQNRGTLHSQFVVPNGPHSSPFAKIQSISASLDELILQTQPIFQAAPSLFKNSHLRTKANIESLRTAARSQLSSFRAWSSKTPDYWQPKHVRHQVDEFELFQLDIFPGPIDMYSDCK
jgi:hypothetical protein